MKHVKSITPARAVVGNFDIVALFGFWVAEVQNALAEWKGMVGWGFPDNVDPDDVNGFGGLL